MSELLGTPVVTAAQRARIGTVAEFLVSGADVGAIDEVYLSASGALEGYEVSSSRLDGIRGRSAFLLHSAEVAIGEDVLVISDPLATRLAAQPSGPGRR